MARAPNAPWSLPETQGSLWLVDPIARTLEVYALERERWLLLATRRDDATVRAEPSGLWAS